MSNCDSTHSGLLSKGSGVSKALEEAAESDQLDDRDTGITVGGGIKPPYPPERLADLQELNGTHATCIRKKAQREVGFGFNIVPYGDREPDDASDDEYELVHEFWFGTSSKWKLGPSGTSYTTPEEVLEKNRQDYHGIGWQALEILYAGADDEPQGGAYVPAKSIRKARKKGTSEDSRIPGHGYVQKRDGETVYFAEAGDRHADEDDPDDDPVYVDRESGEIHRGGDIPDDLEPANEILWVPNPHPNAVYYGIPPWIAELQTIMADHAARRFNRKRLENDLMLDYLILVEGGQLTEETRSNLRDWLTEMRESDEPELLYLEAEELAETRDFNGDGDSDVSISLEPAQHFNNEDASFTEYREMNERDIAQAHEVPLQVLGHHDATNSNSEEAVREFTQEVIQPAQERLAERIYRVIHQQILGVEDWTIEFVTRGAKNRQRDTEIAAQTVDAVGDGLTVAQALELFPVEIEPDDSVADMLLSEIVESGGLAGTIEDELDERATEIAAKRRAAERIGRGAEADD